MPFVRFSGASYTSVGYDFTGPGVYEVDEAKKAQILADYPDQFSDVVEGEVVKSDVVAEEPAAAPVAEVEAPAEAEQVEAEAAEAVDEVDEKPAAKKGGK